MSQCKHTVYITCLEQALTSPSLNSCCATSRSSGLSAAVSAASITGVYPALFTLSVSHRPEHTNTMFYSVKESALCPRSLQMQPSKISPPCQLPAVSQLDPSLIASTGSLIAGCHHEMVRLFNNV